MPKTFSTPEIRVEAPEEEKFGIVERAAAHFAARYPVNTIDGVRMKFPDGWGLIRASNTQPVLVLRFEATDAASLAALGRLKYDRTGAEAGLPTRLGDIFRD